MSVRQYHTQIGPLVHGMKRCLAKNAFSLSPGYLA